MPKYFEDLGDKVVFFGLEDSENSAFRNLGIAVLHSEERWSYEDEEEAAMKPFLEDFELAGVHLASADFYQGLRKMGVIKRKADGSLFGFEWFDDISKHGEEWYEPNGDEHGFDYGDYVFLPVEEYEAPLRFYRTT